MHERPATTSIICTEQEASAFDWPALGAEVKHSWPLRRQRSTDREPGLLVCPLECFQRVGDGSRATQCPERGATARGL